MQTFNLEFAIKNIFACLAYIDAGYYGKSVIAGRKMNMVAN